MRRFVTERFRANAALRLCASFIARFSELLRARCADDVAVIIFFEWEITARRSCLRRSLLMRGVAPFCFRRSLCVSCAFFASKKRSSSMFRCCIIDGGRGAEEMATIFCRMGLGIRHKIVSACLPSEPIRNCGNPPKNARAPSQKCANTVHGKCNGR